MSSESLHKFWPLMYATLQEYWKITEPHIERAADQDGIPIELYYYGELGSPYFSVEDFQKRDPYTNPERFENAFARLDFSGWIIPAAGDRYQTSQEAQDAVRKIVHVADVQFSRFALITDIELMQLSGLLKRLLKASFEASEPPKKWAIAHRFRMIGEDAPLIAQVREALMYMYAYRDDANISVAHPHFGQGGIVWSVLGYVWKGTAFNAKQMAARMDFRGYETFDYEVAIDAAVEIGWLEAGDAPDTYCPTQKGKELRELVDKQTDEYFYRPWNVLTERELGQLDVLLTKLHDQLAIYGASSTLLLR